MADEIESDSETEYEIKKLSAGEDLVIDGETAVDDLLVAQRIAEREAQLAAEIRDPGSSNGEAKPSKSDVKSLMTLLRQANELSQRICSLPEEFDGIMGNGVRSACKAAVEAMEKKLPETEPSEEEEEEEDNGRKIGKASASAASQAKALEGLDLDSTDEEEDASKQQTGEPTVAPVDEPDGEEAEEDEVAEDLDDDDDEDEDDNANELSRVIARAGFTEIAQDSDESEEEKEPRTDIEKLTIKTKGIVETIPLESEIDIIGEISSVVNDLVVVMSPEGSRALDLQSVVCLSSRDVVGVVVDTFGPVVQPYYLVYPTSKRDFSSMVGVQVFAAVGLDETSYLCDSASPFDLEAVRRSLLGDMEDDGDDGDEGEDDEGEEGDEDATKEELDRKALDDIGPEALLGRAGSKSKQKGKGKGKGGKFKGVKGSKSRRVEASDFPKDEGVWSEPGQKSCYGVEDVKEESDERRQYVSTRKPTRWKLWRGKRQPGTAAPPVPAPPPPPKDPRASSAPPVPAPPPPAPRSSRQQQSARGRNDDRAESHNPPHPPSPRHAPSASRGWTPSESSTRFEDSVASRPGERRPRRQRSGYQSSDDRPFKQPRSSNASAGSSSALPPPPPPASSQRAAGRQRGSSSNGRSMAEETDAPWRRKG